MKKGILIGLATIATVSLVACGKDSKQSSDATEKNSIIQNESENESTEKTTEKEEKVELTDEFLLSQPETDISSFIYKERDDGTIEINYYQGENDGTAIVVIPAQINGKDVTKISQGAFTNANVKAVITGKNVSVIAGESFSSIKAEKILINGPVKELYENTFILAGASYITLPDGLEIIGPNAFLGAGIKEITIPASVKEIGGSSFSRSLAEVVIIESNSVEIQTAAFAIMENLEKIYIPSGDIKFLKGVFNKSDNVTIITPSGSTAEEYAKANGIAVENE